jgi:prepilin-type N-terminal cleavage/methylation domain-containing protein
MRSFVRSPSVRGFTLLEMVIALTISGILVTLVVSVWLQVIRASTQITLEVVQLRERESQRRALCRILEGIQWSSTSLASQGGLPWQTRGNAVAFWSRETLGRFPGPGLWIIEPNGNAQCCDPDGGFGDVRWSELQTLRLEVLFYRATIEGEQLDWIAPSSWEPGSPFRPIGLRFWITWKGGDSECIQRYL